MVPFKFKSFVSRHTQLVIFAALAMLTMLLVGLHVVSPPFMTGGMKRAHARPPTGNNGSGATATVSDLTLHAELAQTKLVQGQDGTVYVNLAIQTPETLTRPRGKTGTDIVVVLDRSPSMMAANKWRYAKAAVLQLLHKLEASDRLGLVAFDRHAAVYAELVAVTPAARQRLTHVVQNMTVGSATNIGDGLLRAKALIENSASQRVKKMLLLSDGETNTGITDPNALAKLASEMSEQHIVLSTIGMGLGFNEALMATLADYGMGNYAYLEHLGTLGHILAKDLDDTRQVYAESSELRLHLPAGVKLEDAAGYPVATADGALTSLRIKTGQLLWGAHKSLMLTLKAPTMVTGDFTLGTMALHVNNDRAATPALVQPEQLAYAVVEPAKQDEAVASIDTKVYRKSWVQNNLGRMRQQFYHWVKTGEKRKAQAVVDDYRRQLHDAEARSGLSLSSQALENDMVQMETELNEAFRGAPAEQSVKQNRFSKKMQYQGRKEQRQ